MNTSVWTGAGCPNEQVLLDLTLGALSAESRRLAGEHLGHCALCADSVGAAIPFLPPNAASRAEPGTTNDGVDTPRPERVPPRRSLKNGQILRNTYEIVRFVGGGGMGEVYEARHARLVGRYAIKILHMDLASIAMARARFRREAIASELRHPHIVQVIDFDETEEGQPFLALEFLEGRDLGELLADTGPLPIPRALALTAQIASGLSAMHRLGIVHRDLKPANVVVLPADGGEPERIKLVDFGLSRRQVPSLAVTQERALLGTPQYMAPEQARGDTDIVGPAADQFAMGALVYEMLSGRPAFSGESLAVVLYRIVHESPLPLSNLVPGLSIPLASAIERALSKDVDRRFPSVRDFMEAITAIEVEPRAPHPQDERRLSDSASAGTRRFETARRRGLGAVTAALAVAAVGIVVLWNKGAEERAREHRPSGAAVAAASRSATAGQTTVTPAVAGAPKPPADAARSQEPGTLQVTLEPTPRRRAGGDHRKKSRAVGSQAHAPAVVEPALQPSPVNEPGAGEPAAEAVAPGGTSAQREQEVAQPKTPDRREKKPKVTAF